MSHVILSSASGSYKFNNPAPVVHSVSVSDLLGTTHPQRWDALVDTGADRSAVPLTICEQLQIKPCDWRKPWGFDPRAPRPRRPLYWVRIVVTGVGDIPLKAYGIDRSDILLGRDFLSALLLVVDSPGSRWRIRRVSRWAQLCLRFLRLC